MADLVWTKQTLGDVLGEDRGFADGTVSVVAHLGEEDLAELRRNEREAALSAFARGARQSRDHRAAQGSAGGNPPPFTAEDLKEGLRAARAALEFEPAGTRSERAETLISGCAFPPATGPDV
ncbi:hypothetical protein DLJ49_14810 [Rhodovulum sp. 12E13]|uniref:hypothetical protein n=1 Tax=Rhodovulum sp. 12E13 TaxID=2203891 RepID=UPI000E1AFD47|nr:hypothetical protein [Rhodovulum sp. 12E13]RDC71477.1 hypothetical protein DLJ49_14810 [Rhodovulum sp. 12E13]